ncbi:MAG: hypothetical protein WBV31_13795 [Terriglobales bacterium]
MSTFPGAAKFLDEAFHIQRLDPASDGCGPTRRGPVITTAGKCRDASRTTGASFR